MSDFFMRDGAPISAEVWAQIDSTVIDTMRGVLAGRRFINLVGPLGYGREVAPVSRFITEEGAIVAGRETDYQPLKELAGEFVLHARQLAMAEQTPFGLDLGAVAIAALELAKAEDDYLLGGFVESASSGPIGDWTTLGGPFAAVSDATAGLLRDGFQPPFALVVSPAMFARLASLVQMRRREMDAVREIVSGGIFQWLNMPDEQALVVSPAPYNFDMVVGQDAIATYLGNEGLDQSFRILETLLLRVKRPGSARILR